MNGAKNPLRARFARRAIASLLVTSACAATVHAQYLTIHGGTTYSTTSGGYRTPGVAWGPGTPVNNAGVAVAFAADLIDAAGNDLGPRALRWDAATGITEMHHLGVDPLTGRTRTEAYSINKTGVAVGFAWKFDTAGTYKGTRAVKWDEHGLVTELGTLRIDPSGYTDGVAWDVNDAGVTVGSEDTFTSGGAWNGNIAVRWDATGNPTALGHLGVGLGGSTQSTANAVNNAGVAVGRALAYNADRTGRGHSAVRWDADTVEATELGNLGTSPTGRSESTAVDINSVGTAVGHARKYDSLGADLGNRATRWEPTGTAAVELGVLGTNPSASTNAYAYAINDAGDVVGVAAKYDDAGIGRGSRAVRWNAGQSQATELGHLGLNANGESHGYAFDINAAGAAVGWLRAYGPTGADLGDRAVYWGDDAVAVDLNSLIDPGSGWMLTFAYGISDTNWIVGTGLYDPDGPTGDPAYERLFLLQIPEPSAALTLGAFLTFALRRRPRE